MLYARVARADVLKLRQFEYVEAARAMGARHSRILLRHIIPNLVPTLVTLAILEVSAVILAEAGLSFLGLGVPDNSWGRLIADGQKYISSAWWLVTFPGLAILLTTMSLAILANWIVVFLDPGQRARAFVRVQSGERRDHARMPTTLVVTMPQQGQSVCLKTDASTASRAPVERLVSRRPSPRAT